MNIFWLLPGGGSIFLEVVGNGGYILDGGGWWWIYFGCWWVVVGRGIVKSNPIVNIERKKATKLRKYRFRFSLSDADSYLIASNECNKKYSTYIVYKSQPIRQIIFSATFWTSSIVVVN